jgi:hypothetical protein
MPKAVSILVIGVNPNGGGRIFVSLLDRMKRNCVGWDIAYFGTPKFSNAVLYLARVSNVHVIHLIDEAEIGAHAYSQGCEQLAFALAEYQAKPLVNFPGFGFSFLRPIFKSRGIEPKIGSLEAAVLERWRTSQTSPVSTR